MSTPFAVLCAADFPSATFASKKKPGTIATRVAGSPPLLYTDPKTGELRKRTWRLTVLDGPDQGRTGEVDRSPALVGAAPAAVLVLTDDTVSRYHVEMDVFAEGIRLRDLDSTNGTFIGKLRVRDGFVENGDVFRLGRSVIRAEGDDESAAPEIETDPSGVPIGAVERIGEALAVHETSRGMFEKLRQIAPSPSALLLVGEVGTGKLTCARIVHELSPRAGQPFVCLKLEPGGVEQEVEPLLFGTAGKDTGTPGAFESASGGTLFIEHVDRLPIGTQPKVVRAVEAGEVQRIGAERRRRVDVRVISSCTALPGSDPGLADSVIRRLGVVHVTVPPLRQRIEDIRALAAAFIEKGERPGLRIGDQLAGVLESQEWPTNGDGLRAAIGALVAPQAGDTALRRAFVTDVVTERLGDVSASAEALAMPERALWRFLSEAAIDLDGM